MLSKHVVPTQVPVWTNPRIPKGSSEIQQAFTSGSQEQRHFSQASGQTSFCVRQLAGRLRGVQIVCQLCLGARAECALLREYSRVALACEETWATTETNTSCARQRWGAGQATTAARSMAQTGAGGADGHAGLAAAPSAGTLQHRNKYQ